MLCKALKFSLPFIALLMLCACIPKPYMMEPVPPPTPQRLIHDFPKWERVQVSEKMNPSFSGRVIAVSNYSAVAGWAQLYDDYIQADTMAKLKAVNLFFNQWLYMQDPDVWGVDDYWATPAEFMENSGDCEDYAITKFYALKTLGVPAEDMAIAAVWNTLRNEGHAILIVVVDGQPFVLDNFNDEVVSAREIRRYIPFFYINDQSVWLHKEQNPENGGSGFRYPEY